MQLTPESAAGRRCAPVVVEALRRSPLFFSAALPLRLHGPMFNRYEQGMGYGEHFDNAVTRGTRLAAILWAQSMVRDDMRRRILFEIDLTLGGLQNELPGEPEVVTLTGAYHSLLRLWAET